jgi:chemotaxis family two-component system response regulator PixG
MTLTRLTKELDNLSKDNSDGVLILSNHTVVWNLYLTCGKLLYATSEVHPVRRWNRALKQHCPNWNWSVDSSELSKDLPWECQILAQGISQRQLSAIQAKLVIRNIVQECFFELNSYADFNSDWKPRQKHRWHLSMVVIPLSSWEILSIVNKATNMQQKWQAAGLGNIRPNPCSSFKARSRTSSAPNFREVSQESVYLMGHCFRTRKIGDRSNSLLNSLG